MSATERDFDPRAGGIGAPALVIDQFFAVAAALPLKKKELQR